MSPEKKSPPREGITLVELIVVSALAGLIFVFILFLVRNFGSGVTNIQRFVPMQRDLQLAKQVIEKDLLSAPRNSIGNVVPNPGFEAVPTRISTFTPTTPGFWAHIPVKPRLNPGLSVDAFVSARPGYFLNGNYGVSMSLLEVLPRVANYYSINSSTFTLVPGVSYLFGGWAARNELLALPSWEIRLLRQPVPWPNTVALTLPISGTQWRFYVSTFVANGDTYRTLVGCAYAGARTGASFDDIIVTPLSIVLIPGGPSFEFETFQVDGPTPGQRDRVRYRVVPDGLSGRLMRERVPLTGPVIPLDPVNKIRRVLIGWDFGQGAPGALPAPATWPTFFAQGMKFPLSVTIETGNVVATGNNTLSLTFSVFPEAP